MPRQKKNWDKEWEIPEDEQGQTYDDGNLFGPDTDDPPPVKKLKRARAPSGRSESSSAPTACSERACWPQRLRTERAAVL